MARFSRPGARFGGGPFRRAARTRGSAGGSGVLIAFLVLGARSAAGARVSAPFRSAALRIRGSPTPGQGVRKRKRSHFRVTSSEIG